MGGKKGKKKKESVLEKADRKKLEEQIKILEVEILFFFLSFFPLFFLF